jgi:hypothetical protein
MSDHNLSEEWRPVVGWESLYQVSNLGCVRSLPRVGGHRPYPGKVLAGGPHPNGYRYVWLCRDAGRKHAYVHRLVLEAFVGPRPDGFEVCHNDGDGSNNALSNLRWGSKLDNAADRKAHGTHRRGERTYCAKMTEAQVKEARRLHADGAKVGALARQFGLRSSSMSQVLSGQRWAHIPRE